MSDLTEPKTLAEMPDEERKRLVKVMRRISRRNALHGVIDAKTGALSDRPDAAALLLRVLKNSGEFNWRQRTVALIALRWLPAPPEDSAEAARVIGAVLIGSDTHIGERIVTRGLWIIPRWLPCLIPLPILIFLIFDSLYESPQQEFYFSLTATYIGFCSLYAAGLLFASPVYDTMRTGKVRIEAAQTLTVLRLPESIGALAKTSCYATFGYDIARNALLQMLPTLTEAHYGQLGADATPGLCALLTPKHNDAQFTEKILAAIGKVGDGRAVAPIERFAAHNSGMALGRQAKAILPVLRLRCEQENHAALLLRGSSAPPVSAGELLRAASASAPTPPETLLRPASEPPEPPPSLSA